MQPIYMAHKQKAMPLQGFGSAAPKAQESRGEQPTAQGPWRAPPSQVNHTKGSFLAAPFHLFLHATSST